MYKKIFEKKKINLEKINFIILGFRLFTMFRNHRLKPIRIII
jgi:hypothetical protein